MAKILFGAIIADARRSLGGTVFARGFYGSYAKIKASPIQPQTTDQRQIRSAITANAKGWYTAIDQTQRNAWIAYASTITLYDTWSNPYVLTGIALFIGVNGNLHTIGVAPLPDPPPNQTVTDLGGITLSEDPGPPKRILLTTANAPTSAEQLVVCGGRPFLIGRKLLAIKSHRILTYYPPNESQPIDITDPYSAKFGFLPLGQVIPIAAYNVRNTNGAKGAAYRSTIVLT